MNKQKQREACARLDGFVLDVDSSRGWKNGSWCRQEVPTYDTFDDMHRLIGLLNDAEASMYGRILHDVLSRKHGREATVADFVKADKDSEREALLKSTGNWEDE